MTVQKDGEQVKEGGPLRQVIATPLIGNGRPSRQTRSWSADVTNVPHDTILYDQTNRPSHLVIGQKIDGLLA